jgi:hypothetical protein
MKKKKATPKMYQVANLWSLVQYPTPKREWSLERKLEAVAEAGFDGITTVLNKATGKLARKHGLKVVGFFSASKMKDFRPFLEQNLEGGAYDINVQLGDHDTLTERAVALAVRLMEEGRKVGVQPAVEIHRDTCTETPEKTYALADGYRTITGQALPMTLDYSHFSVVKHLAPPFSKRLLERRDIVQNATQVHFRTFNGHHCQVPVTDGKGRLTPELKDCLPVVEDIFRLWLKGNSDREQLWVCPEMGPVAGGYNFHSLPNSWEEAKRLRTLIASAWRRAVKGY